MSSLSDRLDAVIKAYDVRGIFPDQFDESLAQVMGAAMVEALAIRANAGGPGTVAIGWDMRDSSPAIAEAFARGVSQQGADVLMIGLASTDGLYFASGSRNIPGAMITASHNPAEYNGIKMCRAGAAPVGQESGLRDIRALVEFGVPAYSGPVGLIAQEDMTADYAAYLRSLVDLTSIRPLRVVIDAGNGMAGYTVPAVLGTAAGLAPLPLALTDLFFELDGTFPNHEANPIDPATLVDVQRVVLAEGADLGLAFDGDADRCFVVDENGALVSPSAITALIAERELQRHPGSTIIHNLITSRTVPEIIAENAGVAVRTRVGHSFIKAEMARTGAVFGGEHSGHFYFHEFWRADSGMLAAMHVLAALGETSPGVGLSSLLGRFNRYAASGEVNSRVRSSAAVIGAVRLQYCNQPELTCDDLDGLTVSGADWWFNLRPSNTEPLLRLNVEASDEQAMTALRDSVLALIQVSDARDSSRQS